MQTYNIDGLRVDTAPYVPTDFWDEFSKSSGVYTIGEVFDSNSYHLAMY